MRSKRTKEKRERIPCSYEAGKAGREISGPAL